MCLPICSSLCLRTRAQVPCCELALGCSSLAMARRKFQSSLPTCKMKDKAAPTTVEQEDVEMCSPSGNTSNSVQNSEMDCGDKEMLSPGGNHGSIREACEENCNDRAMAPLAGDTFVGGLGIVLSLWVKETASAGRPQDIGRFHSSRPPPISIQDYIHRLRKYFRCSDECFVLALVYIDRSGRNSVAMAVSELTIHRLIVIAVMIAAKFHDDTFYDNRHYGKAGGMTMREINVLEAAMLKALDWRTHVTVHEYGLYHDLVCTAVRTQA